VSIIVMWGLLGLALPAQAGSVYRCLAPDGAVSYASKRLPGTTCRVLGHYRPAPVAAVRRPASDPAPVPTAAVRTNDVETTAADSSAPAARPPAAAPTSAAPRLVQGQVYAYIGPDGVRNYTSVRPAGVPASAIRTIRYSYIERCYACGLLPGVDFRAVRLNTTAYRDEIAQAAREMGVEEAIVRAIIHAESAFQPNAISRVGAQGLMQLMPGTARRFGVADAFDVRQNIRGGVQYLAWLLRRFNGNLTLAAAGYNAGEGAVERYGGVPPYAETQRYVQRVGVLVEQYRGALRSGEALRDGLSVR